MMEILIIYYFPNYVTFHRAILKFLNVHYTRVFLSLQPHVHANQFEQFAVPQKNTNKLHEYFALIP